MNSQEKLIRIVRIVSRLNVGGPAQHVILLTEAMQGNGFETKLVSGMEDEREENMLSMATARHVEVMRISAMRRSLFPWNDFLALWQLIVFLRRYRPHIVHTHTAKSGALGRIAAWIAGVPVVVHTFHGHVFSGYFHPLISWIFVWVERLLARHTELIITLTPRLREELLSRAISGRKGIEIVPLGLALERFRILPAKKTVSFRRELGLTEKEPLIGIIGRLVPIKRHTDLLKAVQLLNHRGERVHLAIIGGGELEGDLRLQAKQLGLENQVYFCGFRQDLEVIYPALDLVVLASANEGMPVCLIEAMTCGIPIVATAVGGVPDLLSDYSSCKTVSPRNEAQLAGSISDMLANIEQYRFRAQNNRAAVFDRYNLPHLVRKLACLYQNLLEVQ